MSSDLLENSGHRPRLSPWRQRLKDAETGLRIGLRGGSTLFAHFFFTATVVLASSVLQLTNLEWVILILVLGFSFSSELMFQVLRALSNELPRRFDNVVYLGTTAVMVTHLTTVIVCTLVLWKRFAMLWRV
ncbi:diacylglycerol kinase [Planctomicrobium sp. SH668]|uniref:diacylglycerol kinase n=1 Tax=Planctomicrobium sp. SH668 TaxID=3448126 RepID=UPI003F5B3744